jgi:hypothetical protein
MSAHRAIPGPPNPAPSHPGAGRAVAVLFALAALGLLVAVLPRYGWFRDEFYYLNCAERLAWGYVDHPPLSVALLALVRAVAGESLWAVRLVPALAFAATVYATVRLARRLGAGAGGQALAGTAMLGGPVFIGMAHVYSMNALELLLWTLAAWALVRALETRAPGWWLGAGALLGLGLLNKLSASWWLAGLAAGLLASRERRALASPWPWAGVALALLMTAPFVAWQAAHDWPTVEFMRNATRGKMLAVGPGEFALGQVMTLGPATLAVALVGLVSLARARHAAWMRVFAVAWLVVLAIVAANGSSRASYLSPAYPPLVAAGAAALAAALERRAGRWGAPAAVALAGLLSAPLVPFALPVLPVGEFVRYQRALGVAPQTEERHAMAELPQHYADMFGWEAMADAVARAWTALPPDERARAGIFAQNYGEAGAIDHFGARHGLPPAMSGHNNHWLWGPQPGVEVLVILGGDVDDYRAVFDSVAVVDTVRAPYAMPYERDLPVSVARRPRMTIEQVWPRVRSYN